MIIGRIPVNDPAVILLVLKWIYRIQRRLSKLNNCWLILRIVPKGPKGADKCEKTSDFVVGAGADGNVGIIGTFTLMEAAKILPTWRQTRFRFVDVSTDEVYGLLGTASDHVLDLYEVYSLHQYGMPRALVEWPEQVPRAGRHDRGI
jgi:hypothetical protein